LRKKGKRERTKDSDRSAEWYSHVAQWCNQHSWIEVGYERQDELFARAIHKGWLVWGGKRPGAGGRRGS
jgi:hypothetical protein